MSILAPRKRPADTVGFSVLPATVLSLVTHVATRAIDCAGYDNVDFTLLVSNFGVGPITSLVWDFQWTNKLNPAETDWSPLESEAIAAGVATQSDYLPTKDVTGKAAPYTLGLRQRAQGRFVRARFLAGAGNPAGSSITVTAMRR